MKLRKITLGTACCAILLLTGCVTEQVRIDDPVGIRNSLKVSHDEFKKLTYISAPKFSTSPSGHTGSGIVEEVALRATFDHRSNRIEYYIYVMDYSSDSNWRFYDHAYDSDGMFFKADKIGSDVSCRSWCSHYEYLGIDVTLNYLEKHAESGIRMKIVGKNGEEVFSIPKGYIIGFLDGTAKYDSQRLTTSTKPAATAATAATTATTATTATPSTTAQQETTAEKPLPKITVPAATPPTTDQKTLATAVAKEAQCSEPKLNRTKEIGHKNVFEFTCAEKKTVSVSCDFNIKKPSLPINPPKQCYWS